jgi:hypothetical protein
MTTEEERGISKNTKEHAAGNIDQGEGQNKLKIKTK